MKFYVKNLAKLGSDHSINSLFYLKVLIYLLISKIYLNHYVMNVTFYILSG